MVTMLLLSDRNRYLYAQVYIEAQSEQNKSIDCLLLNQQDIDSLHNNPDRIALLDPEIPEGFHGHHGIHDGIGCNVELHLAHNVAGLNMGHLTGQLVSGTVFQRNLLAGFAYHKTMKYSRFSVRCQVIQKEPEATYSTSPSKESWLQRPRQGLKAFHWRGILVIASCKHLIQYIRYSK